MYQATLTRRIELRANTLVAECEPKQVRIFKDQSFEIECHQIKIERSTDQLVGSQENMILLGKLKELGVPFLYDQNLPE